MAGLKKPTKRRDPNNPNPVLVGFLVFFVLLSIGLGLWAYSGLSTQEKLKEAATKADADKKAAKLGEDYYRFVATDTALAIGAPVDPDFLASWKTDQAEVVNDGPKYKAMDEKSRTTFRKMFEENKTHLGLKGDGSYGSSYKAKFEDMSKQLKNAQAALNRADDELKQEKQRLDGMKAGYDAFYKSALDKINKGNKEALDAAMAKTAEIEEALRRNNDLQDKLAKADTKHQEEKEKLGKEILNLTTKLAKAKQDITSASQGFITRTNTEPHALLLDISRGKALWDLPLGKIVKVNFQNREVVINIGSSAGVKPETAFNVFGAGPKDQAEGLFKGSVEVVRVLGPNTSLARITSMYDAQGGEIMLNDPVKGRISREADNPLKDGDLLFNLAFGTRVAIAGNVNWSGYTADTPAEQMRNLNEFMHILRRQGVKIDAYLDMTDGKLKGTLSAKTRFLIRGDNLGPGADGKVSDEAKKLNAAIDAVRAEAIEKGLFIISPDNFASVIGYRRPRSANDIDISHDFRPSLPGAILANPNP
jgi:hypothetical protein